MCSRNSAVLMHSRAPHLPAGARDRAPARIQTYASEALRKSQAMCVSRHGQSVNERSKPSM